MLLSTFRVSSIGYYFVSSLPIHKICALCGIFSAISVLLMMENSDDLEIQIPDGSSVKVIESYTNEFLTCDYLLVINCTRGRTLYRDHRCITVLTSTRSRTSFIIYNCVSKDCTPVIYAIALSMLSQFWQKYSQLNLQPVPTYLLSIVGM